MTKKLFVGNLPSGCTNEDLKSLFETVGQVVECDVLKNFGFVHMGSETESQEAVTQLDKTEIMGYRIQVQFSTSDVHKSAGVGSKGECFKCGSMGHFSRDCPKSEGRGDRPRGGGRGRGRGGGRGGRGGGGPGGRGGRGGSYRTRGDIEQSRREERREREYYGYGPPRRLPPDPYYDRYYDDYYRRPPYPYPPYSRDYPYPPYRARSRSPPPRRPVTPPRYRRRPDSPGRDYLDYPPGRFAEGRSRYPPPPPGSSRYSPPSRAASAF